MMESTYLKKINQPDLVKFSNDYKVGESSACSALAPVARSNFVVDGFIYRSLMEFFLLEKASHTGNFDIGDKILDSEFSEEHCLNIARENGLMKISDEPGFVIGSWGNIAGKIMYKGCLAKYEQNPQMAKILKETGDSTLIYCEKSDPYFGIGLKESYSYFGLGLEESDPVSMNQHKRMGKNVLGEILARVRGELREKEEVERAQKEFANPPLRKRKELDTECPISSKMFISEYS